MHPIHREAPPPSRPLRHRSRGQRFTLRAEIIALAAIALLVMSLPTSAAGQTQPQLEDALLRVYLDCNGCDFGYIRREIDFVDHVRDRQEADVHILVTREGTGSGGTMFKLDFIGLGRFSDLGQELPFTSLPSMSHDDEREGLTRVLKAGLVPYLLQTPVLDRISIDVAGVETGRQDDRDPWRGWVFQVYGDGWGDVEESQSSLHVRYGFYADRVTEMWRIRLRPYFNYSVETFDNEGETIKSTERRDGFDSYVIRGLTDHWSVGIFGDAITTTYDNIDLRLRLTPAVEYSVFPYREASRRELTFAYHIGLGHVQYMDTTIYGQTSELLPRHMLRADLEMHQPWGSIDIGASGQQYLHDTDKYRVDFWAGVALRIVRGLSLHVGGNTEIIHDQLNLPQGGATLEEILLRRRQLATNYEFSASVGFSYTFGSIYNNVVNTRL